MILILENTKDIDLYSLKGEFVKGAQQVYDAWDQNEEGYCDHYGHGGGICQDIASSFCEVLSSRGIECSSVSQSVGEQHVYAVAKTSDGVFSIDIPPSYYETGGGYCWKKIEGVEFEENDIKIYMLSNDPSEYESFVEDW
jgi:hypothetical protein